jgi:hypothetical protein
MVYHVYRAEEMAAMRTKADDLNYDPFVPPRLRNRRKGGKDRPDGSMKGCGPCRMSAFNPNAIATDPAISGFHVHMLT